jgi:hypothetical protein
MKAAWVEWPIIRIRANRQETTRAAAGEFFLLFTAPFIVSAFGICRLGSNE